MRRSKPLRNNVQRGMVLIAVLWIVAALSIIVSGITRSVREEARMLSLTRQSVEFSALGDAAIQLALQEMASLPAPVGRLIQIETVYQGVAIPVEVMPLNGLIDINAASMPLLSRLYSVAGGISENAAEALAQATIEARQRQDARGTLVRFEAIEDLLQVPGVNYTLYARLSGLITADLRGAGKVNPLAAPLDVLTVLAGGNLVLASKIAADRQAGLQGIDTTVLDTTLIDSSTVRRFRLQARVPMPSGTGLLVSRSVDLTGRSRDGAPWQTFHSSYGMEPKIATTP
ncbi:MAG: general secretion pathway protein GspK [Giesbergeria sp.]|nr:general secretion pathway protein GspK [Giesbergeria sp.]